MTVHAPIAIVLVLAATSPPLELKQAEVAADFAFFVSEVKSTYAYFDVKATRWDALPALYERDLRAVRTRQQFVAVLENAIAELYDDHAHLNVNTAGAPPLIPSGTDLWAEWFATTPVVTDVRLRSEAERAGIRPGAEVVTMDGVPIATAVERMIGRAVPRNDTAVRNWALRRVLAGRRNAARRIEVEQSGRRQTFELPARKEADDSAVTFAGLEGSTAYIRFNDSLGDDDTIADFDRALAELRDSRGLVIDLRDTPSGGNSTVARGILGRFVTRESAYQVHELPGEERATGIRRRWIELVSPRGPFQYAGKVVVLVGRWTGSMGEGLAIGFDATGTATIVGRPMAQLLGATYRIDLPTSRIGVNLPAERLYHVNGTPREAYRPPVLLSPGADALEEGIRIISVR